MFKFINITKLEIAQELIKELIRNSPNYHPNFQTPNLTAEKKSSWDFTSLSKAFANPDIVVVPNSLARLQINKILSAGHAISGQANVQFPKHFRSGEIKTLFKYINDNKIRLTQIPPQYAARFAASDETLQAVIQTGKFDELAPSTQQEFLLQAFRKHINKYPLELNETYQGSSTWAQVLAFQDILDAGNNKFLNDIYRYEGELPQLCTSLYYAYQELARSPATMLQFGHLLTPASTGFTTEELAQGLAAQPTLVKGGMDNAVLEPNHIAQVVNQLNNLDQNSNLGQQGEIRDNPLVEPEGFNDGYTESLLQEYGVSSQPQVNYAAQHANTFVAQAGNSFAAHYGLWDNATEEYEVTQALQREQGMQSLEFAEFAANSTITQPQFVLQTPEFQNYQELHSINPLPNTGFRDPRILTTTYSRVQQVRSILSYYADFFPSFYLELENEALDFRVTQFAQLNTATQKFIHKHFGDNQEIYKHEFLGKLDILHRVLLKYKLYNVHNSLKEEEYLARRKGLIQHLRNLPVVFTPPSLSDTLKNIYQDYASTAQAQRAQAQQELLHILGATPEARAVQEVNQRAQASSIFFYTEALDFMQNCKFEVVDQSIQSTQNVFILGDKLDTQDNINFYDTLAQLLGYNIYYFNQVPTFGMWKTQAALGREELLNYRLNQVYCNLIEENHELQHKHEPLTSSTIQGASAIFASESSAAQTTRLHRKSEVNNNPLTYWGQVAHKTSQVLETLKDKSCDIMHIYYDVQEVQQRQQHNLQHLEHLLATYTHKEQVLIQELDQATQTANSDQIAQLRSQQTQAQLDFYAGLEQLQPLPSLLTQLQKSIYEYWDFKPHQPLYYLAANDNSIQIYAALNKKREIEYVQQQILQTLAQDPSLELDDILVVSPVIDEYAPIIPQVFDQYLPLEEQPDTKKSHTERQSARSGDKHAQNSLHNYQRYLPYQILDYNREVDELLNWCKILLTLRTDSIQVYDLETLLAYSWMQEFYGLTPQDLTTLTEFLNREHKTNEAFGELSFTRCTAITPVAMSTIDEATQEPNYVLDTGIDYNSWQQILLQLGLSNTIDYKGHTQILGTIAHSKANAISVHELVSKFQTLFLDLQELAQLVQQEQEFTAWFELMARLARKYLSNFPDEQESIERFIYNYSLLIARANSLRLRISNLVFLAQIEQELQNLKKPHEKRGCVTFAGLNALTATNYKFVIAMGMGANNFPTHRKYFELDLTELLTTQSLRPSQYELDVHSFLQLLLNTGKRLLFTYEGFNSKQELLNICQPLETLRVFLDNYCGAPSFHGEEGQLLNNATAQQFDSLSSLTPIQQKLNLLLMGMDKAHRNNLFSRHNYIQGTQQQNSQRNFQIAPPLEFEQASLDSSNNSTKQQESPTQVRDTSAIIELALTQLLQTSLAQTQQQSLLALIDHQVLKQQKVASPANQSNQESASTIQLNNPGFAQQLSYLLPWLGQQTSGTSEWLTPYLAQHTTTITNYFSERYYADAQWLLEQVYGGKSADLEQESNFRPATPPILAQVNEAETYSAAKVLTYSLDELCSFFKDPSVTFKKRHNLESYPNSYSTPLTPIISAKDESKKQSNSKWQSIVSSKQNLQHFFNSYLNGKYTVSQYSLNNDSSPHIFKWIVDYYKGKNQLIFVKRKLSERDDKKLKNINVEDLEYRKYQDQQFYYQTTIQFALDVPRLVRILKDFPEQTNNSYLQSQVTDTLSEQLLQLNRELCADSNLTASAKLKLAQQRLGEFSELTVEQLSELLTPQLNLDEINLLHFFNSEDSQSNSEFLINLDVEFDLYLPKGADSTPNSEDNQPALYFRGASQISDSKNKIETRVLEQVNFPLFKILAFMHTNLYKQCYTDCLPNLVIENFYYYETTEQAPTLVQYFIDGEEIKYLSLNLNAKTAFAEIKDHDILTEDLTQKNFKSEYSLVGNTHKVNDELRMDYDTAEFLFARILSFYLIGKDLHISFGTYNFFKILIQNRNLSIPDALYKIAEMYISCFMYSNRLFTLEPGTLPAAIAEIIS